MPAADKAYYQRHWRLRRDRGSASQHVCVHCIEHGTEHPARDWAQVHGTDGEDVWADYVPLCRKAHIAYDGAGHHQPHTAEAKARMGVSQKRSYAEGRNGLCETNKLRKQRASRR